MKYMEIRKLNLNKNIAFINYETLRLLPNRNIKSLHVFPVFCCQLGNEKNTGFKTNDKELLVLKHRTGTKVKNFIIISDDGYFHLKPKYSKLHP